MDKLETLFRILDENFIMYKRLNNGTHIKIWSDDNQKWINFYPSSGKVHWDGEKSNGRGINYLLSQLGIDFNTRESMECILVSGKIERKSDNQFKVKGGSVIRLPFGKPFSIVPSGGWNLRELGDILEIKTEADVYLMSCNKMYFTEENKNREVEL